MSRAISLTSSASMISRRRAKRSTLRWSIHHVVEFQELLADVELRPLDLAPRARSRLLYHPGCTMASPSPSCRGPNSNRSPAARDPKMRIQVVPRAQEERGSPRIALPTRTRPRSCCRSAGSRACSVAEHIEPACRQKHVFLSSSCSALDPERRTARGSASRIGATPPHLHTLHSRPLDARCRGPAMFVAMVTAAGLARIGNDLLRPPASCWRAFSTLCGELSAPSQELGERLGFLDRCLPTRNRLALAHGPTRIAFRMPSYFSFVMRIDWSSFRPTREMGRFAEPRPRPARRSLELLRLRWRPWPVIPASLSVESGSSSGRDARERTFSR